MGGVLGGGCSSLEVLPKTLTRLGLTQEFVSMLCSNFREGLKALKKIKKADWPIYNKK